MKQKTAIVTGGSGGIGKAICRRLASDGMNVVVHFGSNRAAAQEVVAEITAASGNAVAIQANVADESDTQKLFAETIEKFGKVDVVVASAGLGVFGSIGESTLQDFEDAVAVNLRGAFLTMREAARRLTDSGRIVTVSSQLSRRPMEETGIYSATKAAVDAMVVSLAAEVGSRGITVNSVLPGATSPGMFDASDDERREKFTQMSPFKRLGTPDDAAGVVAFLASDDGAWMTGQHLKADGGATN